MAVSDPRALAEAARQELMTALTGAAAPQYPSSITATVAIDPNDFVYSTAYGVGSSQNYTISGAAGAAGMGALGSVNIGLMTAGTTYGQTYTIPSQPYSEGIETTGSVVASDLILNGKSISKVLENIERRLGILRPNEELEDKWNELKALGDRYRELEAELSDKEEMWKRLAK